MRFRCPDCSTEFEHNKLAAWWDCPGCGAHVNMSENEVDDPREPEEELTPAGALDFVNLAEADIGKARQEPYLKGHMLYAVAMIAHAANQAYARTLGQQLLDWDRSPKELKMRVVMGVSAIVEGKINTPSQSHEHWLKTMGVMGWTFGLVKDEIEKTHPNMVPWLNLDTDEQRKDMLFFGIVVALLADPSKFGVSPR